MAKPVIICVDDEKVILSSLKQQLKRHFQQEYFIELVESGDEAIELIKELIDSGTDLPLLISDYIMPGMKGDELLIQCHQLSPKTLTILLTGQASADAIGNAVNHECLFRFMAKPWSENDLILTIKEAIRRYDNEKLIKWQAEEYRSLVENINVGIFRILYKPFGRFLKGNTFIQMLLGYHEYQNVINLELSDYMDQKELEKLKLSLEENNEIGNFEVLLTNCENKKFWVAINARTHLDNHQILWIDGTVENITQRVLDAEKLKEANEKINFAQQQLIEHLKQANEEKSKFLFTMSHEIRTPLNAIIGFSELMIEDFLEAEEVDKTKLASSICQAGKKLFQLTEMVLDLKYMENDDVSVHYWNKVDLVKLIKHVMDLIHDIVIKNKNEIDLRLPPHYHIQSEPVMLEKAIFHVIENACKFTENGIIEISLVSHKNDVNLNIKDTGIGIPQNQLEFIFQPFSQVDQSATRKYDGSGLGLTLSAKFIKILGGMIVVKSEIDKGSDFIITLPVVASSKAESVI